MHHYDSGAGGNKIKLSSKLLLLGTLYLIILLISLDQPNSYSPFNDLISPLSNKKPAGGVGPNANDTFTFSAAIDVGSTLYVSHFLSFI